MCESVRLQHGSQAGVSVHRANLHTCHACVQEVGDAVRALKRG